MSLPENVLPLGSQSCGYAAAGFVDALTSSLKSRSLEKEDKRQAVAASADDFQTRLSNSPMAVEDTAEQTAAMEALAKVQALITSCFAAIAGSGFYARGLANDQKYGFWMQWNPNSGDVACLSNNDSLYRDQILPGSVVVDVYYKRTGALRIDWKNLKVELQKSRFTLSKMALDRLRLSAKVLGAACWSKVSKGYGSRHFEGGIDEERLRVVQANTGVILETWKRVHNTCMKHAHFFSGLVEEPSQDRASTIHSRVRNLISGTQFFHQKGVLSLFSLGAKPTFKVWWHPLSGEMGCLPISGGQPIVGGARVVEMRCIKTGKLKIDWEYLTDELYTGKTAVSIFALKLLQVARKSLQRICELNKGKTEQLKWYEGKIHTEGQHMPRQEDTSKLFDEVTKNCLRRPEVLLGLLYVPSSFDDKVGTLGEMFEGRIVRIERSAPRSTIELARVDSVTADPEIPDQTTVMLDVLKTRTRREGIFHFETQQKPLVHRQSHSQVLARQIW